MRLTGLGIKRGIGCEFKRGKMEFKKNLKMKKNENNQLSFRNTIFGYNTLQHTN